MHAPATRLVALTRDERDTLGRLAGAGLTVAGERIGWAEGEEAWDAAARQVRAGIAHAEVLAALLEAAAAGVLDLGLRGLRSWLDGYAADLIATLDDDRVVLRRAEGSDERTVARAFLDDDLDALLLVRRLRAELRRPTA
jgi:hypothetical protein